MQKRLLKSYLMLMIGLLAFTSCNEDETESIFFRTDGTIGVVLKDENGSSIANAKVELYNQSTENRIRVENTDENGVVNFGRFEAGEYYVSAELMHNEEYFSFGEEVHIVSGVETMHEMNIADQRAEVLVRFFNNGTGELVDFDLGVEVGFIPMNDTYYEAETTEDLLSLVQFVSPANGNIAIDDLPVANYRAVLFNDTDIFESFTVAVNAYDKRYVNFYINPLPFLLGAKELWNVSAVTSGNNTSGLIPFSSVSFNNGELTFNLNDGTTYVSSYSLSSNGYFSWSNIYAPSYTCYFNEETFTINANGSITFNFSYWETNSSAGYLFDESVSITIN